MSKSLYANGQILDIDDKTVIAISDNSQPFNNLFAVTASKSNTFKLPATVNNCNIFENLQLPASGTLKRYERADIIYIQDEIEIITNGIGYINKSTNDSFELVVYSRDADLFEKIKGKTLQDLVFSNFDYLHTSMDAYGNQFKDNPSINNTVRTTKHLGTLGDYVRSQYYLRDVNQQQPFPMPLLLEKIGIFPMVDYDKDSTEIPQLEREMGFSGESIGVNDIDGRSATFFNEKHVFPAIYLRQIIRRMFADAGFGVGIPNDLFSENVVIPFCNDTMQLKAEFVAIRYAENSISAEIDNATFTKTFIPIARTNTTADACVSAGRYRYGHVSAKEDGTPIARNVFFNGLRVPQVLFNVTPAVVPEYMEFEIDLNITYFGEFEGVLENNKILVVWENTANLTQFEVIKEYELQQRQQPAISVLGVLQNDFTGGGRLISEKFDTNNYFVTAPYKIGIEYNSITFQNEEVFTNTCDSWQIALYSEHQGKLIISDTSTIKIKPKAKSKKIRNVIWGIAENLPAMPQVDFLRAFLMFNGLEMSQNQVTKIFTFSRIDSQFYKDPRQSLDNIFDLTNKLDTSGGYQSKIIGSTFAKKNTFEYKKDSSVKSGLGSFTVEIPQIQTGKESQNIFTLPFAISDDSVPSQSQFTNGIRFKNSLISARIPIMDKNGVITGKVEPKLLAIREELNYGFGFASNYNAPWDFGTYEPPLWLRYGVQIIVGSGGVINDFESADSLYFGEFTPIRMQQIALNNYNAYQQIIKTTTAYSADFLLNAEDYLLLRKNRVIKITKGDLEGLWYINKMTNFVDSTRTTELELQKLTNPN